MILKEKNMYKTTSNVKSNVTNPVANHLKINFNCMPFLNGLT